MVLISSPQFTTTDPPTSEQHGATSSTHATNPPSPTYKLVTANTNRSSIDNTAPFWWLLLHLDMLIFAPSTRHQCSDSSTQGTIRDRIDAAFSGNIAYLFNLAMQVQWLMQNTRPTYIGKNRSAQLAANDDQYRTAVGLACSSQSIATIGPHNISYVNKLYTQPVTPCNHPRPTPSSPHQSFSLPGDICNTILHAAKNKGAGINADSIDLSKALVKQPIPSIKPDLHYIFDLIYQNKLPQPIKRYFTDVYLFCLHKDPTDTTKLPPLGIPTAIRHLIVSHITHTLRDKFASHLLPYNYVVGIPNGSDFVVKGNATLDRKIHPNTPTNQHPTLPCSRLLRPNQPI